MRIALLFLLLTHPLLAKPAHVTAVLFYATHCPHCHELVEEGVVPLLQQHPSQLEIIFVNVQTELGGALYEAATEWLPIEEEQLGVPALIVNDTLLLGKDEILQRLPPIVQEGVESSGFVAPPIPGLQEAVEEGEVAPAPKHGPPAIGIASEENLAQFTDRSLRDKLAADPLGNTLAITLLTFMVCTLIFCAIRWKRAGIYVPNFHQLRSYLIPLLSLAGIAISIYMTYVESREAPAVCGPIGNCNAVQQSPYATLFGTIHVGLVGIGGYALIALAWLGQAVRPQFPRLLLPSLILLALLFSIYLTFLEPFVIGAACIWCLGSALIVTCLAYLTIK